MNEDGLLKAYRHGLGYKPGDVLRARPGAGFPAAFVAVEVIDGEVVVLNQSSPPHEYSVVGERKKPTSPADRFYRTTVNGHDYEKVR